GRRAKILRVGHLLIRQTVHVQHAFIAALAQTGIAIAEVVINEPDAVFAVSDSLAAGALRAIAQAGLRVPGDIAVIGFDGTELA
ncbi:substrate-binding domain-containing protein, partial [Klebsiella pneumoniae]|uniref:substrate-binding domain-containing protein n=1 Tax=Klebsiella pneumoniae TaxID=573 RepID=UPI001E56802E